MHQYDAPIPCLGEHRGCNGILILTGPVLCIYVPLNHGVRYQARHLALKGAVRHTYQFWPETCYSLHRIVGHLNLGGHFFGRNFFQILVVKCMVSYLGPGIPDSLKSVLVVINAASYYKKGSPAPVSLKRVQNSAVHTVIRTVIKGKCNHGLGDIRRPGNREQLISAACRA